MFESLNVSFYSIVTRYSIQSLASNTLLLISTSYKSKTKFLIIVFSHVAMLYNGEDFYNKHISLSTEFKALQTLLNRT